MRFYAVYDKKAEIWNTPFPQQNDQTALRAFRNEVNRPDATNTLNTNPEDFSLYAVGEWNKDTGELRQLKATKLAEAIALRIEPQG